ncbi:aldehyde dehydrogenase family protein, partial [Cupriavidus sp. SK-3]|uniref:aldehyde dehydrogenase family protein n=1 Tax=Cupriavidus sp. SK-3 TaxID=1470558 RepID=UPI0032E4F2ED
MNAPVEARSGLNQAIRNAMLIDGEWRQAESGETFAVFDPATGEEIARVPAGGAADIDAAVAAAGGGPA